jgi:hypothetical protein
MDGKQMSYNNDTHWISIFTIAVTSGSNRVYANGRHQVQITVGVTAQEGEEVSAEQMEGIRLVRLDEDGNYQSLSGELLTTSERDDRFDYYADPDFAPELEALESASLRKTFYVSSTRAGESRDVLCAVITAEDGVQYVSHSSAFNASVTLESMTPFQSSRDDFGFIGNDAPVAGLIEADVDCDIYSLYFRDPKLKIVASTALGANEGVAYYQGNLDISPWYDPDEEEHQPAVYQNFSHYAYNVGEAKTFSVEDTVIPLNQTPGAMNFVRLKTTSESPESDTHHEASRWELLDQYGNAHRIEMTQENDGDVLNFVIYE